MTELAQYTPDPAFGARIEKTSADKWTLILVRDLRHSPSMVWQALTQPEQLREWAPFEADGALDTVGAKVKITWVGTGASFETTVTQAFAPHVLEFGDIRWELEQVGNGTRLTLWHAIDRRFIAWGTAGWHVACEVLDKLLSGTPIGRAAGADPMKNAGWQRLVAEYAAQFGIDPPTWARKTSQSS
jgi:uncharacterized protein YndB with AHSA1/START domain